MDEIHNVSKDYGTSSSGALQHMHVVVRGSLKAKLPPSINIRSADLRVLDPIGQGRTITTVRSNYLV